MSSKSSNTRPMSKTTNLLSLSFLLLLVLIKSSSTRPFSREEFKNAIMKNSESRWIEEIFENDTDFENEESNHVSDRIPSNRDLLKSLNEDYHDYDEYLYTFEEGEKTMKEEEYLYTYEEDPIIEIRFKRDTEELTTRSENEITRSSTTEPALVEPSSNAFPKSLNNNLRRRNRRLKKNLSRNRRLRKALRKDKKFLSNRT